MSYLNLPEEITFMNKGKGYLCGVPDIAQFVALRKYNNGAKLHGEKQFQQMCKKGKIYTDDCFTYYPYGSNIAKVKKVMVIHEKVYGNKKNYTKWNDGCRLI